MQPENVLSRAHYRDADLYDKRYARRRDDVAFYVSWAKRARGEVLELGAGTGRLTNPMRAAGAHVVAVDRESSLLARVAPPKARLDFTRRLPSGRFPLVLAPFNTLSHVMSLLPTLQRIRAACTGTFIFDVPLPDPEAMRRDPERVYRVGHSTIDGIRYAYSESFEYDPLAQTMLTIAHYDAGKHSFVLPLLQRWYFPQELRALLEAAGFRRVVIHGDFKGGKLTRESVSQVVIAR